MRMAPLQRLPPHQSFLDGCSAGVITVAGAKKAAGIGAWRHNPSRSARCFDSAARMSTKRYSVRDESEADVKRYVKCIFARKRGILGLLASKESGWSDRHCCAVPRGTVISVTCLARRVD